MVAAFRKALGDAGVALASMLPLYRWSGPDEDERQAAVRYWKRAIEITAELGCSVMNSEFNGRPEESSRSESQFWRSMEDLLPIFEREGMDRVSAAITGGAPLPFGRADAGKQAALLEVLLESSESSQPVQLATDG